MSYRSLTLAVVTACPCTVSPILARACAVFLAYSNSRAASGSAAGSRGSIGPLPNGTNDASRISATTTAAPVSAARS